MANMTVRTRVHTLTEQITLVGPALGASPHDDRRILIQAEGDLLIGGPDIVDDDGLVLAAGDRFEVDLSLDDEIYARAVTGTTTARTLETRATAFTLTIGQYPPLDPQFGDVWEAANGDTAHWDGTQWVAWVPQTNNICVLLGNSQLWIGTI